MAVTILLAACGGTKSEPTTTTKPAEHGEHDEMANMPPAMVKFHDVLAPHWHATPGDQRMKDTCAAVPDFTAGVTAIATAAPPQGADSTAWDDAAGKLAAAVSALGDACKQPEVAAFDTAFRAVHESFHDLMGLAMGEHEHEPDHGHAM